jgi:hypothetical protein
VLLRYQDDVGPVYLQQLQAEAVAARTKSISTTPSLSSTSTPPSTNNDDTKTTTSSTSQTFTLVESPLRSRRPQCWQRPSWLYYPGLDARTWHSPSDDLHIAWTKQLVDNFDGIKQEFMKLRQKRFDSFEEITNTVAAGKHKIYNSYCFDVYIWHDVCDRW